MDIDIIRGKANAVYPSLVLLRQQYPILFVWPTEIITCFVAIISVGILFLRDCPTVLIIQWRKGQGAAYGARVFKTRGGLL